MKLKKLIAAFLSAVMVVSLVPAMLFSVSADEVDPGTEQQEKLPIKDMFSAALLSGERAYAFDGDSATSIRCMGYDASAEEAANQYIGCSFPAQANITSVYVKSSYPQLKVWEVWTPQLSLDVSEDGENWVQAYIFNEDNSDKELATIDQTIQFDEFKEEAKAVKINYARLRQTADSKDYAPEKPNGSHTKFWNGFTVNDILFYGDMDVEFSAYDISVDPVETDGEGTVAKIKLSDTSLQLTSGTVVLNYNKDVFTCENGQDGVVTVDYTADDIQEDGTVAEIPLALTAVKGTNGSFLFRVSGAGVTADKDIVFTEVQEICQVGNQQQGMWDAGEVITLTQNPTAKQDLWTGSALLEARGMKASGVTFVYKVEGITDPIVANAFWMTMNGGACTNKGNFIHAMNNAPKITTEDGQINGSMQILTFEEDGYFFLYLNQFVNDGIPFTTVSNVSIFNTVAGDVADKTPKAANTNENATFQLLAVVANNLKPTVNFYGKEKGEEDNSVIATYTHTYSKDLTTTEWGTDARVQAKLISAEDMFTLMNDAIEEEASKIPVPTKASNIDKVTYEFENWVDEDGNVVDAVYASGNVYPKFKMIDNRERYTIKFVNYDDSVIKEIEVIEGETIQYEGDEPEKPSTDEHSYEFSGWDPELAEDTVATADATYKAQYIETERKYDVTFMDDDKETKLGKVRVASGAKAELDETPTKEADAQYTYTFAKWVDAEGKDVNLDSVTADMTVYASYSRTLNKYTVTFMSDGEEPTKLGEVKVDYGTKAEIETPTKPNTDEYAYTFDKWVDAEGNEADLNEVKENKTVYASYTAEFIKFVDLGDWYDKAVEYVYTKKLMVGTSNTEFGPEETCTRGMLAAILYRQEGSPSVEGLAEQFTDVPKSEYYYNATLWAYHNGVVYGVNEGNTLFAPEDKVTREEMATMLYRYASKIKGYDVSYDQTVSFSKFADRNDISEFAQEPLKYALHTGFISGDNDKGTLKMKPQGATTRAEMASMLMRFLEAEHTPAE